MYNVLVELARGATSIEQLIGEADSRDTDEVLKDALKEICAAIRRIGFALDTEHLRIDSRVLHGLSQENLGSPPGLGPRNKSIMEYKVIQGLAKVSSDKSIFRQWHQKFMSAIGQVNGRYSIMIEEMVKLIDLGKSIDKVLDEMDYKYAGDWNSMSEEMYKVLIDKADGEAYDKIKSITAGDGCKAYAIMYKWFTDVSGLGLSEQTRRLMHPEQVTREEDLA